MTHHRYYVVMRLITSIVALILFYTQSGTVEYKHIYMYIHIFVHVYLKVKILAESDNDIWITFFRAY